MGERCNRTAEVRGSIPLGSTNDKSFITKYFSKRELRRTFRGLADILPRFERSLRPDLSVFVRQTSRCLWPRNSFSGRLWALSSRDRFARELRPVRKWNGWPPGPTMAEAVPGQGVEREWVICRCAEKADFNQPDWSGFCSGDAMSAPPSEVARYSGAAQGHFQTFTHGCLIVAYAAFVLSRDVRELLGFIPSRYGTTARIRKKPLKPARLRNPGSPEPPAQPATPVYPS